MGPRSVREGMKIKIIKIDVTNYLHSSNDHMQEMVGNVVTVSKVRSSTSGSANSNQPFMIEFKEDPHHCVWDPDDLQYAGPPIVKPKAATFDPKNLIV